MKILVCLEPPSGGRASRAALATALGLGPAHTVSVVSAGKDPTNPAIEDALALGATNAVHVLDRALADPDFQTLGSIIAAVATRLEVDLVLAGAQSDDESLGAVPAAIAHHFRGGVPILARAETVATDPQDAQAVVVSLRGGGRRRSLRVRLPAVVSVSSLAATPPKTAAPVPAESTSDSAARSLEVLTLRALGIDPALPPRRPDVHGMLLPLARKTETVASAEALLGRFWTR
jgi:electron transfer flavoprotein beta subunit